MKFLRNAKTRSIRTVRLAKMLLSGILFTAFSALHAYDQYQYEVLLNPSQDMLRAEDKGRSMIYDGLENETVELAMTSQFNRIENMMFVRTRYIQPDGDIEVEEDGCD